MRGEEREHRRVSLTEKPLFTIGVQERSRKTGEFMTAYCTLGKGCADTKTVAVPAPHPRVVMVHKSFRSARMDENLSVTSVGPRSHERALGRGQMGGL